MSRFDIATYCSELCRTYKHAGIASFQLSPVKTEPVRLLKREVAGKAGDEFLAMSYKAMVKQTVNLSNSLRKTAVDVMYRRPPTSGI